MKHYIEQSPYLPRIRELMQELRQEPTPDQALSRKEKRQMRKLYKREQNEQ